MLALLVDQLNVNVFYCTSSNSKRVTQSVLASELYSAFHALNYTSAVWYTLNCIFDLVILWALYTDSKSFFYLISGLDSFYKRRLPIDPCVLRQVYELRELTETVWILSPQNPADAMTIKDFPNDLVIILKSDKINLSTKSWVERPTSENGKP